MVLKAVRTKDLSSYSLSSLVMTNLGNLVHSLYVYSLPPGPIWALHAFYLVTTVVMLVMFLRHDTGRARVRRPPHAAATQTHDSPDEAEPVRFLRSRRAGRTGTAEPENDDEHYHHDPGATRDHEPAPARHG
jgi:hypothetical protein